MGHINNRVIAVARWVCVVVAVVAAFGTVPRLVGIDGVRGGVVPSGLSDLLRGVVQVTADAGHRAAARPQHSAPGEVAPASSHRQAALPRRGAASEPTSAPSPDATRTSRSVPSPGRVATPSARLVDGVPRLSYVVQRCDGCEVNPAEVAGRIRVS